MISEVGHTVQDEQSDLMYIPTILVMASKIKEIYAFQKRA